MQTNQDWDIKPRGNACAACQGPFGDKQTYVSHLAFGAEGYLRQDYCFACWAKGEKREGTISIWHGVFHPPPPPPEEPLKKETAESLLRSLMKDNDPAHKNVIFILAVMLERRRLLVEREVQTREDGATLRVYEHRLTGDTFVIIDPQLDLNQLGHVQEEVMRMLGGPADPGPEPAPADGGQPGTSDIQAQSN